MRRSRRQLTVGDLIARLEVIEPQHELRFDFCYTMPDLSPVAGIDSYRGYYEDVAIAWRVYDREKPDVTVGDLLRELKAKLGTQMQGYKGGWYEITNDTAVWVANHGDAGSTAVVNVVDGIYCYLITEHLE